MMMRREFITLLGGATAAWPLAAHGQQPKLPTIGFLGASTAAGFSVWVAAFTKRLHELSWTEGRTVAIEYRWAEGRSERYSERLSGWGIETLRASDRFLDPAMQQVVRSWIELDINGWRLKAMLGQPPTWRLAELYVLKSK
jgi:hypothetical protein